MMLIAPASCNTIAKMANGICDNLLQAVYLSATCPVMIAPAMDEDMWIHPATKLNIDTLKSFGNKIINVTNGELASGFFGEGRMAEPEDLLKYVKLFFEKKNDLAGKKILISAGPTQEPLDPVRFISNYSTGKMGIAIANECVKRGAEVQLVIGVTNETAPQNINVTKVKTAAEMYNACVNSFAESDIAIMCAAVADYTPVLIAKEKIKKKESIFNIELKKTEDILKKLGTLKTSKQLLVGFALETENEKENALKKLKSKNADYIILNSLNDKGAGFGYSTNKITIFDKEENEFSFETKSKQEVAEDIINTILKKTA
ncbi:MAG: bifunctional phosphopantothenoylcysteine decarboxylase/phosphopantothenate--cysteine ligase CoaBC, partial [Ferruginibacter sp.]|nr:bifunctional phosphopantothenoylcysteine decarboxylase/phosphopantothenate--cysteine ligase CoaBC [Ferruginibacter sp.]